MKFTNMHTHTQTQKGTQMYAKHTQKPTQQHTQKSAQIWDMLLCLKDRFYHFCHRRVHYQESNISSIVQ